MEFSPVKIGIIGSGNISFTYLNTLVNGGFKIAQVVGCSDLIEEKSALRAKQFNVKQMTTEEILSDPAIEIVLNLTQLWHHNDVTKLALEAGKHVYSEKAMGSDYAGAKANYDLAKQKGLRYGCAPDCYMGAAYQTQRKLIDDGMIGQPLMATAVCFRGYGASERPGDLPSPHHGKQGVTITYDMSGYYINALVALLGPVKRVSGFTRFFEDRVFTNPEHPRYHQKVDKLSGPTMIMACLEFVSGAYASMGITSEGFGPEIPRVEIYGTQGTLTCTDPNVYGGWGNDVYLTRVGNNGKFHVPFSHGFQDTDPSITPLSGKGEACHNGWRGLAVVDMAWALRRNRPHRSSAELALHAVEIIHAVDQCTLDNQTRVMQTRPERPAPLAPGYINRSAEASIDTEF